MPRRPRGVVHRVVPFLVLATSAADGSSDASPKGGPPGFVRVFDEQRLGIPEFPGNRRFDGVHNIVDRPGIGLIFVIPGIAETLRVNGRATLSRDPALTAQFEVDGKPPWFVIDVEVQQVFSHCSKAFLRSHLWKPEHWPDPEQVRTPFRSVYQRAEAEGRTEAEVRAEVEKSSSPSCIDRAPRVRCRMFTARATTMIASRRLAADSAIISSFAQWRSGSVSVGLKAVALV